ncbi:hypothetical protein ACS0TY_009777 [Phlomoides rotata]
MIQNASQSPFLNYVFLIAMHLKWAWGLLLRLSFSHHSNINRSEDFNITRYKRDDCDEMDQECAICLCKIDEDDEIRELRCDHLFHRGCLDRWLGHGGVTCPVCRHRLKFPAFAVEHHQEVVYFDFCAASDGGRDRWWVR